MPTYSYRCTECGKAFDVQQSFTDASLTVCPSCNGVLRKVFSPVGVSFTGSGFYRNDSRAKPKEGASESGGESSEKSSSTESKPATPAKDSTPTKPAGSRDKKATQSKPTTQS